MRVCVLTPSPKYRSSAGARIRYLRIEKMLLALGHSISLLPIEEFRPEISNNFETFILSKCYDTRGLSVARILHHSGKLIGVDFFDDNFSQVLDSRLLQQRRWMTAMDSMVDFALCSTPTMGDVVAKFWPDKPRHVMNDPFAVLDLRDLASRLDQKLDAALNTRRLSVVWFGQGDNPRFPVGLRDLAAFGEAIGSLSAAYEVDLTILTNRRSLTADGLQRVHSLPAKVEVREWSEANEQRVLKDALIAFLPVNAQPFSTAKSMNRAITALTSSAQVLSTGYPLYDALSDFIYSSADDLLRDLSIGNLRLRRGIIPDLAKRMTEFGDPAVEAAHIVAFWSSLAALRPEPPASRLEMPPMGVLHGIGSPNDCHRSIQRLGHFSIASPFSRSGPRYDVWIDEREDALTLNFSERLLPWLAEGLAASVQVETPEDRDGVFCRLPLAVLTDSADWSLLRSQPTDSTKAIPRYAAVMAKTEEVCRRLAPAMDVMVSEGDPAFSALLWEKEG